MGMHLGARQAENQLEREMSAEQYARLPWVLPHAITKGLYKRSEMDFELTEEAIEKLYERGADVFAGLRVRPRKQGVDVSGLELHDIRIDSFLERLGVASGDVLLEIDSEPMTDVGAVRATLERVRERDSLIVDLERNGEKYQLMLRVQVSE